MKKRYIFLILFFLNTICGFTQTELIPKKKVFSPQFEKLMRYHITDKNEPIFVGDEYGYPIEMHLENTKEGALCYATCMGRRGDLLNFKKGTIIAAFSNNRIEASVLIIDLSEKQYGLFIYGGGDSRTYCCINKSVITLEALIEQLIEDQTDCKWIKDEL